MKPFSIVLSINLAFFAIWGMFFTLVVDRPELIPLMTSIQTTFNLLACLGFYVDKKPSISWAFLWGIVMSLAVTIVGYILLIKYRHLIGVEESYTAWLEVAKSQILSA